MALPSCSGPTILVQSEGLARKADPDSTGSIDAPPRHFGGDLGGEDWRRAHAALAVALDPQGNGKPVKWENPETAARGSIDPKGLPYVAKDMVCRDFLASVHAAGRSRSLRGTGCKPAGSGWVLKRVRPA